jgi:hypothetical protein
MFLLTRRFRFTLTFRLTRTFRLTFRLTFFWTVTLLFLLFGAANVGAASANPNAATTDSTMVSFFNIASLLGLDGAQLQGSSAPGWWWQGARERTMNGMLRLRVQQFPYSLAAAMNAP